MAPPPQVIRQAWRRSPPEPEEDRLPSRAVVCGSSAQLLSLLLFSGTSHFKDKFASHLDQFLLFQNVSPRSSFQFVRTSHL